MSNLPCKPISCTAASRCPLSSPLGPCRCPSNTRLLCSGCLPHTPSQRFVSPHILSTLVKFEPAPAFSLEHQQPPRAAESSLNSQDGMPIHHLRASLLPEQGSKALLRELSSGLGHPQPPFFLRAGLNMLLLSSCKHQEEVRLWERSLKIGREVPGQHTTSGI